jgi:hypothetical protein
MHMSQELFERIVGTHSLGTPGKAAVLPVGCRRAPERRKAVRVAIGKRTQIRRDSGSGAGNWATVMVRDISVGGLALLSEDEVGIGETFVVRLPQRDGKMARIRCATRRCEPGGFGGTAFLVGASFEQVIEEPSIRLNEDDGQPADWDVNSECAAVAPESAGKKAVGPYKPRSGFMRVAAHFLKVVNPTQWIHRQDDFSSN